MKINLLKKLILLLGVSIFTDASDSVSENQQYIDEIIDYEVRAGFSSMKDIEEIVMNAVEDNEFEKEFPKKWVKSRIKQTYSKMLLESKKWKEPTDVSLLIKAFKELNKNGIIAFHNAGYTSSDGVDNVKEVLQKRKTKHIDMGKGYCFYHQQDLERAMDPDISSLYVSSGALGKDGKNSDEGIAKQIIKTLKKYNFKIKWDENESTKIQIVDFKWQNLYNPKVDLSEDAQIERLTK